jgi:hypothetical protein
MPGALTKHSAVRLYLNGYPLGIHYFNKQGMHIMSKKFLAGCALTLMIAGQESFAASVFSFSGGIGNITSNTGVPLPTYNAGGVYLGAPVTFDILLDATLSGYVTTDGVRVIESRHTLDGLFTRVETWTAYAGLLHSNLDVMSGTRTSNMYSNKTALHLVYAEPYYEGEIRVGQSLSISKQTAYGDESSFLHNWQVSDTLNYRLGYGTGVDRIFINGTLTLNSISTPLPSFDAAVPIPGASLLFFSGLACMGGLGKMRRSRQVAA